MAASVDEIRDGLMEDWNILENVFRLLQREDTFCADPQQWGKQKIVPFLQPDQLKVRHAGASDDLKIRNRCQRVQIVD